MKRHLYEQIFRRQISTRPELKRLLLAVLVCEIARETEKNKKKKEEEEEEATDFVSNPCHDKTNPDPLRFAP